jgi:tetratricopeptide (TPR) repeat protein/tRNA A-37 threonylcarbamoyl transferase component Bud32
MSSDEETVAYDSGRLTPGTRIGPYRVEVPLGSGGVATVYRALDTKLNRRVAIKVLSNQFADKASRHRFRREAQTASSLNHPHILTVHDEGEFKGRQYLVTEFVDGGTLKDWMQGQMRAWPEIVELMEGVADGLAAAHDAGITHRDVKPANILVAKNGYAKLADFGLAKLIEARALPEDATHSLTSGFIVGTIAYMSPEQASGRPVDARSDIFSFGVVLYELLSGRKPFPGVTDLETLQRIIHGTPAPLPEALPLSLRAVVEKALKNKPADRYQTMREVVADLRALTRTSGETLTAKVPTRLTLVRPRPETWKWLRLAFSLILVLVIVGGYWVWFENVYQPNRTASEWYQRGLRGLHSMTYDAARKALEEAVKADPKFALAYATLARAYDELDYSDLAKDSMLHALALADETRLSKADEKRLKAYQFMVSRDYERAAPLFAELENEAAEPDKAAAALESGWVAQQREDTDAAAAAYERAGRLAPQYAAAKLRLAYIEGRRRQVDAALKTYAGAEVAYTAASDYEGVTESLIERASLLIRSSRTAEALPLIEKALSASRMLNSPSQRIRLELAESVATRNLGDSDRASVLAQQAVDDALNQKMENVATTGLIDLGNAFLARGDLEPAEMYYRRALDFARRGKARRNEARAQVMLGSLFEQKAQPADAQPFLEAALPFYRQAGYRRELVQTTMLLGSVHQERAEFDEGIRILRDALPQAVDLGDKVTEALLRERLGDCLIDQGLWPEALKEYEHSAVLLGPGIEGANARIVEAQIYWRLGRIADAEQSLSEVENLLDRSSAPERLNANLKVSQLEMAYARGNWNEAAAAAVQLSSAKGADTVRAQAALIQALVLIRTGRLQAGLDSVRRIIQRFEQDQLIFKAASTRLATAEALLAAGEHAQASQFVRDALLFFEPHRIWESVWRGHLVLVQALRDAADRESHRAAARSTLDELKAVWPARSVETYLTRSDIELLYSSVHF